MRGFISAVLLVFGVALPMAVADVKPSDDPKVLWVERFDDLKISTDLKGSHSGWYVGNPPGVSMTVKDGVATLAEIGPRHYAGMHRYVPYDLKTAGKTFPYLQVLFAEAPGKCNVGNASTGGQTFVANVAGPGLLTVDLRQTSTLPGNKGQFALSFMTFGPRDSTKPGEEVKIDWIRMTAHHNDVIDLELVDAQEQGQPGHGYVSVGDTIRLTANTTDQYKTMTVRFINSATGKAIKLSGKTEFSVATDQDNLGRAWSAEIEVTPDSEKDFKTWYERQGKIEPGLGKVYVEANLTGGTYPRLLGYVPWGFDLSVAGPIGPALEARLLSGKVMLETNFDDPKARDGWQIVAGEQWVRQRGRFGELSDSAGPDGDGVWAKNGEPWWTDYKFSADMAEELDGAGSVFLAVRFQDPKNYYALEWKAARTDVIQLVRVKDGNSYVLAKSGDHKLDKFPFSLAVAVSGDYLVGYLGDQQVVAAYAGDFDTGPVALGQMGRKVLIDNAKVTRLVGQGKTSRFHRHLALRYGLTPKYFLRDTGTMDVPFVVSNTSDAPFEKAFVKISFEDVFEARTFDDHRPIPYFPAVTRSIDKLEPGQSVTVNFPMDTRLVKTGEYLLRAELSIPREGLARTDVFHIGIARNWNPERFNYFTWGLPRDAETLKDYAEHGHTMGIGGGRATPLDWQHKGKPVPQDALPTRQGTGRDSGPFHQFDLCLKYGMLGGTNLQSTHGKFPPQVYGVNRTGGKDAPTRHPLPYHPLFHEFSVNLAETYARTYHEYPAYKLMNMNTETEFHNHPDFSELGLAKARKEFGDVPPARAVNMMGIPYNQLQGLADGGVIDDDNVYLRFYRWFWLSGEGFNKLAVDMKRAIEKVDPDIIVFHDPADRMPYVRDRHDGINLFDWTYTTPNPLTLPYKTEVLRAMSEPENPYICNYVQVLWKQWTAGDANLCPSASVIRLGLLHSSSRPVFAVGHWNTGWMRAPQNLDRWEGVADLHRTFWKPVGPVLHNLDNGPREIAFLVSHTNELFAANHRGKWQKDTAYSAWYEAFTRASLNPDIIFEETVAEGGLGRYKALFIPLGEVVSKSAYDKIVAFANAGGLVVADKNLGYKVPDAKVLQHDMDHMIWPNWGWYRLRRDGQGITGPERIKKMWDTVDEIARVFAPFRSRVPHTDDKWLVINERRFGDVKYIYAVNDHRSQGAVGKTWNVMFEQGEPLTASITVPGADNVTAVYDLTAHKRLETSRTPAGLRFKTDYAPASATVFALLEQAIDKVDVTTPETADRGKPFEIGVKLLDAKGQPVTGALPIRVTIRDGQRAVSEYSDTFAVKNGAFTLSGTIALNDTGGTWSVTVDDLAGGKSVTRYFKVPPRTF